MFTIPLVNSPYPLPIHQLHNTHKFKIIQIISYISSEGDSSDSNSSNSTPPLFCRTTFVHRRWINGRLHSIGDTVFIIPLGYKGTIVCFNAGTTLVLPHVYGNVFPYWTCDLRSGSGMNNHIRAWLTQNHIHFNNPVHTASVTQIHPSRPRFNRFLYD